MLSDRAAVMRDDADGPTYGLDGDSAARQLRAALADLEGAEDAFIVPSGLAAVTVPLLALTRPGDEVITSDAVYGPSRRFLARYQSRAASRPAFCPPIRMRRA
jgi:cysteine-S-conjugate beta-lyase